MLLAILATCALVSSRCVLAPVDPAAVGMSAERLAAIDRVVERGLAARGYAGMAVVVGRRGGMVWERGYGALDWRERSAPVSPTSTMYDLASLTKVVATTTAIMLLHDSGELRLDDRASKYLPALREGAKARITIRQLLEHRSGFPAGRDLWRKGGTPSEARRLMLATPLVYAPGERQLYSDIGPDILGFIVEAVSGERLDAFLARRVYRPLGMRNTMFRPPATLRSRIPPTEATSPRGRAVRGEVHDENAWALGGVAGHAGLFSSASDLAVFAQMMLNGGVYDGKRILRDSTVALFTRRSAGWRAMGWDTCAGGASCGQHMSERAYGHTGFTGTSIWIDPDNDLFVIVLTNRIYPAPTGRVPPSAVLADVRADIADIAELSVVDHELIPAMPATLRADRSIGWSR